MMSNSSGKIILVHKDTNVGPAFTPLGQEKGTSKNVKVTIDRVLG